MSQTSTIPVTIQPEAAVRVAELGMQRELDHMLEHALKAIPELQSLEVVLELPWDTGDEIRITIEAIRRVPPDPTNDPAIEQWGRWYDAAFPAEVRSKMSLLTLYGIAP